MVRRRAKEGRSSARGRWYSKGYSVEQYIYRSEGTGAARPSGMAAGQPTNAANEGERQLFEGMSAATENECVQTEGRGREAG